MNREDLGLEALGDAVVALLRDRFGEGDPTVGRLAALTVRAIARGHTGLDLDVPRDMLPGLLGLGEQGAGTLDDLPDAAAARALLEASAAVHVLAATDATGDPAPTGRPFVLDGPLLATERSHRLERRVVEALVRRRSASVLGSDLWSDAAARGADAGYEDQTRAVRLLLERTPSHGVGVLTGGPGTGKTRTVATLLGALAAAAEAGDGRALRIGLAAPTGRAAARLGESLRGARDVLAAAHGDAAADVVAVQRPVTVHRLLSIGRDGVARRASDALDLDVVVVDEVSMLDLALAAALLDAVPDGCGLVLVGDQFQLQSVGVGSVLQSLVRGLDGDGGPVAHLTEDKRFRGEDAARLAFVTAVRRGDGDGAVAALATEGTGAIRFVAHEDLGAASATSTVLDPVRDGLLAARARAEEGDHAGALDALAGVRVLCAHRQGSAGVATWAPRLRAALLGAVGEAGDAAEGWMVGEPVLLTANDPATGLSNGDTGVVVDAGEPARFAFRGPDGEVIHVSEVALPGVESGLAVTVHKSQGSEYDRVVVVLPPPGSPLATRELLYTAVTRASREVVLVGAVEAVRESVDTRLVRMGGLASALNAMPPAADAG